ncbi:MULTISPECIES: TonB-dependent receptor [unclassified Massilia]|uniref:TonB-dependent receptor n=1 Tax=unclassified Massilia TaxID=2609279 RepID=UPI00177B59BF|nr:MULTISPECIES: TonB-dependent receptor [unclassified Massilia]MBD8533226.1 TonB-dependent receptor [Massilia sp. CFBP 13647]MBD8672054.1 TonB-dependent receptor [Massilia sp. CFBP 13721]
MTRLKVKPICAAIMLMTAYGAPAFAQTTETTPDATAATEAAGQAPAVVQVTGLRQSLRSAEAIKRDAVQVVDAINADDIGKFPDRQAGDALQRVAGVQVGRDRGQTDTVIIRGLPDVTTTIDGNEIFTAAGRRLSYQDLPVQSIGGMEVYKSATANQFEGGIAGAVNIRLRSPFDAKGFTATGYIEDRFQKTNGSSATKDRHNPGGGFLVSNRWNTSVGEMGALFDVAVNRENWAYPVQWVDRPTNVFSVRPDGTATRLGDRPPFATAPGEVLGQLPNIGGIYNSGKRERQSVHGAFQWKISPQLQASAQYLGMGYQGRNAVNYILNIVTWAPRLTNVVLAPQGSHCNTPMGVICPILSANAPAARFDVGPYDFDPYTATSTWGQDERTTTHYLNLGLRYANGPLTVNSSLGYTRSKFVNDTIIVDQQVPNASSSVFAYGADGHGGYTSVSTPGSLNALRDPSQFVLRGMVQNWNEQAGSQFQWRSDGTYRLGGDGLFSAILGGVRLSSRKASYHGADRPTDFNTAVRPTPVGLFGPSFQQLVPGLDRLGGPWVTPSSDYLLDNADVVRNAYGLPSGRLPDDPTRLFDQTERSATLYLSGRWKTKVAGIDVSGEAGARVVRVNRELRGQNRIGDVISNVDLSTSETNVLPSISAVVGWTDAWQSHLSAGKTIARPGFRELNPALSLVPPTVNNPGSGSSGNPDLEPTRSTNLDATLEYYFAKNGYAQIALFHRDIDGYLQNFTQDEVINGITYRVSRPQNSGKGMLRGAEFGIQKFFDFLPGPWSGFGAQFNYTWIDGENETRTTFGSNVFSKTQLVGVAKKNVNLALLYEGNGITGRLAATRRGDYVEQIAEPPFNQDRVVKGATFVDLSVGYELTPNLSLHLDAINLTREKFESSLGPYQPRDIRYNPTTYGVSLRYKM